MSSARCLCALSPARWLLAKHNVQMILYSLDVYRPFSGGVASWLATVIYVAMVTPILYDNSCSPNDSNLKYESYQPYG